MRKGFSNMEEIKQKIYALQGKQVDLTINKGRNKIVELKAYIDKVYPSMFIIKPSEQVDLDRMSYSYSDVLCGDISFKSMN